MEPRGMRTAGTGNMRSTALPSSNLRGCRTALALSSRPKGPPAEVKQSAQSPKCHPPTASLRDS
eukprot:13578280-Heterocapsa_arctica.AAC.1